MFDSHSRHHFLVAQLMFDWPLFLERHNIEYVDSTNNNVSKDDIGIKCVFCGGDDPSYHLGISLHNKGWSCWRNPSHRGKSPYRLISALIGCSFDEAVRIVKAEDVGFVTTDETFMGDSMRRLGIIGLPSGRLFNNTVLHFLDDFSPIQNTGLCRTLVFPYLEKRGYHLGEIEYLTKRYSLKFAFNGPFAYRIIIPVFMNKRLVNWTGRTISSDEKLRYKSLSTDHERATAQNLPIAVKNIKETLFDYDNIMRGGDTLVVCEGPFDAIRIGYFGVKCGIRATCLFGKIATPAQIDLLVDVVSDFNYDKVVVLFDNDAELDSFTVFPDYLKFQQKQLPKGVKDPAELDFRGFCETFGL